MLEVGAELGGRYTLERLLGHGGFGEVYLARDGKLGGKRVAVKVLHGPALRSPILRAKLLEEATTAAQLGGHHVVRVSDAGDDPQAGPYLVMEYLEGTTLEDHLREVGGRLSPAAVWDIFDQLQQGLSEAHQRGVVHRDLKPANVFLAKAGKGKVLVKLLDFGLAKVLAEG
jgi:serine/threonine protein kinase